MLVVALSFLFSIGMIGQENVFLNRSYWKENPSVAQIKRDIASGNNATALNANAFDPTVFAILEKVDEESIKYVLSLDGNDTEKRTHDSRTYIYWAAYAGQTGIVKHLLEKGAIIKGIKDSHGNTPLTFAASAGQKNPEVYELFEKYGIKLTEEYNENGVSILFLIAPYLETEEELTYLESKGFDILKKDPNGNTLFNHAARKGNVDFLKLLITKGISATAINNDGGNAMLYASMGMRGSPYDIKTFQYLESLGVNANVVGDQGRNPLHAIAYKSQDEALLNYFINKGVDVSLQDNDGATPFMNAASGNNLNVVELLYAFAKADLEKKDNEGQTALTKAVNRNKPDVVQFLISKGVNVNTIDNEGNTLAYYLLNTYDVDEPLEFETKLELLKGKGLSLLEKQHNQKTLLHIATERNDINALKRLASFKIDVNARDSDGYTALHIASMKAKNDDILKYLIANGADVTIKTTFDETAYDLASENELLLKNKSILNYLK